MTSRTAARAGAAPAARGRPFSDDEAAGIAKALAHPARVRIVRLLLEKQDCIGCDIVDEVGLAQSTVSEHLRILKAAGLISGAIEHPRVCYSLNPDRLMPLAGLLNAVFDTERSGAPATPPAAAKGRRRVGL